MNAARRVAAGLSAGWLAAAAAAAQLIIAPPSEPRAGTGVLEVALSPAEITVGDRVEARLTLVWTGPAPASEPRFPPWRDRWGAAEVLSAGEVETFEGPGARTVYRQTLILTAFSTGEVRLPRVTVALPLDGETIEIAPERDAGFTVRSVLPEGRELEPRPPAAPRPLAGGPGFAWTAAGLGGLGLLTAWLIGRRLRTPAQRAEPVPAEPLAELLDHLRRLDPAAAEPAHTGLSLGLRRFLGRRLDFPAAESTTTEIERRLRRARVPPAAAEETTRLLRDCDRVKFARLPVAASVTRGRLRRARDLGRRLERDSGREPGVGPAPAGGGSPTPPRRIDGTER